MSDEPLEQSNAPLDLDNFSFTLGDFTYQMDAGQLFTTNKGVRTEHYAFEYTGPPLYALARAWAKQEDMIAAVNEIYATSSRHEESKKEALRAIALIPSRSE